MTDITYAQVWSDHIISVGEPGETITVKVMSGGTVYYGDPNVSSSTNLGSITVGNSATMTNPVSWLRSASQSYVQITGVVTSSSSSVSVTANTVALGNITGTVFCDLSQGSCFTGTLTGNVTIGFSNWPAAPALTEPLLILTQDGTGGHTIAISGVVWEPSGIAPAFTTTAGAVNFIPLSSPDQGSHLYGAAPPSGFQTFTRPGVLAVENDTLRLSFPVAATIIGVTTAVNTAPTGASIIVDVLKNGTTIFTTQANRPTIAISGFSSSVAVPDVMSLAAGDYLQVHLAQVGSTVAGADLTVTVAYH